MGLSSDDLDRLADDMYKDRRITGTVYCGTCGYNLHSLPYAYRCPECGNRYNARPLKMTGIFTPQETSFPTGDVAAMLFGAPFAVWLIYSGVKLAEKGRFFIGLAFGAGTLILAVRVYSAMASLLRARAVARRIAMEEYE